METMTRSPAQASRLLKEEEGPKLSSCLVHFHFFLWRKERERTREGHLKRLALTLATARLYSLTFVKRVM